MVCFLVVGVWCAFSESAHHHWAIRAGLLCGCISAVVWTALALDHCVANSDQEDSRVQAAQKQIDDDRGYREGARLLAFALPPGARLVTDYPGTMAYYTDAYIIDMFGLTTPLIARHGQTNGINPLYGRTCPACYPQLDPEFFHVNVPIVRDRMAFSNAQQVIKAVWQSDTIARFVDFTRDFRVGRVVEESTGKAVYFLERRKPSYPSGKPHPARACVSQASCDLDGSQTNG
jgi:hypothetical protein